MSKPPLHSADNRTKTRHRLLALCVMLAVPMVARAEEPLAVPPVEASAQSADASGPDLFTWLASFDETTSESAPLLVAEAVERPDETSAQPQQAPGENKVDNQSFGPIDIEADSLQYDDKAVHLKAGGNVKVQQGDRMTLDSEKATYDRETQVLNAEGKVKMRWGEDLFSSKRASLDMKRKTGRMEEAEIDFAGPGGHAKAESMERLDDSRFILKEATYTNCDCDPAPWYLSAEQVDIDMEANQATGRNVTLYLKDTPIAYTPWMRQPVRKVRQSGFLTPNMRYSGAAGLELDVPYYLNIAPERDATFSAHPTSRRGNMGKMQYRYLGSGYTGVFETHNIYDTLDEDYRSLTYFDHRHRVDDWRLRGHVEASKTRDFTKDFHQDLVPNSERNLESALVAEKLVFNKRGFTAVEMGTRWYEDLDAPNDQRTVQRLPYAVVTDDRPASRLLPGWKLRSGLRFDDFYQMEGNASQRLDLAPTLMYRTPLHIGRFSAEMGVRETAYLVQGEPVQAGNNKENHRDRESSLVNLRLDTMMQKPYESRSEGYKSFRHTVEPSLQYVLNASSNQADFPNYDAVPRDFTMTSLFAPNHFTGIDRMSNAQWVSYGVTTRLLGRKMSGETGKVGAFGLGQRYAPPHNREHQAGHPLSDIVNNAEWAFSDRWSVQEAARYNPHRDNFQTSDSSLTYTSLRKDRFAVGYHFNRAPSENMALNTEVKINRDPTEDLTWNSEIKIKDRWKWLQDVDYSVSNDGMKSWKTGLMYAHDCWSLQLSGGRMLSSETADHGGGWIGFFLTFQGLGGYGVSS